MNGSSFTRLGCTRSRLPPGGCIICNKVCCESFVIKTSALWKTVLLCWGLTGWRLWRPSPLHCWDLPDKRQRRRINRVCVCGRWSIKNHATLASFFVEPLATRLDQSGSRWGQRDGSGDDLTQRLQTTKQLQNINACFKKCEGVKCGGQILPSSGFANDWNFNT